MRALIYHRYGGPDELKLVDVAPPLPRSREVQVDILACGLNLSDWENLTGRPSYVRIGGLFRPRRKILGSDIVGRITALGSSVSGWSVGDVVWAEVVMRGGGFAEVATLPATAIARLPDGLDPVEAAALPQPGAIALAGTRGISAGQKVLINGAGGASGPLALQLAHAAGAVVWGVDSGEKADFMRANGAAYTIDYTSNDFAGSDEQWDLILDLVGTRRMHRILPRLTGDGEYRVIGGRVSTLLSALITGAVRRLTSRQRLGVTAAEGRPDVLDEIGALVRAGALRPKIADTIPLEAVPSALARIGAGQVQGKIVLLPGAERPR